MSLTPPARRFPRPVRVPGTMTMGTGKEAAALPARDETRGPGPSLPLPAARTKKEMSSSSLMSLMISSARLPTRIACSGSTPAALRASRAASSSCFCASWTGARPVQPVVPLRGVARIGRSRRRVDDPVGLRVFDIVPCFSCATVLATRSADRVR